MTSQVEQAPITEQTITTMSAAIRAGMGLGVKQCRLDLVDLRGRCCALGCAAAGIKGRRLEFFEGFDVPSTLAGVLGSSPFDIRVEFEHAGRQFRESLWGYIGGHLNDRLQLTFEAIVDDLEARGL